MRSTFNQVLRMLPIRICRYLNRATIKAKAFIYIFPKKVVQIHDVCIFLTIRKLISLFNLIYISILKTQHSWTIFTKVLRYCRLNCWVLYIFRDILFVLIQLWMLFKDSVNIFAQELFRLYFGVASELADLAKRGTFLKFGSGIFLKGHMNLFELFYIFLQVLDNCADLSILFGKFQVWSTGICWIKLLYVWFCSVLF